MTKTQNTVLKRTFFSELILSKSSGQRIAYIAVITALSVVTSMFLEFKMFDVQFSVTIVVSALAGIVLGPVCGLAACYVGDLIGYIYNNWGLMYMPWVGLSTGMIAFLSGLIFNAARWKFRGALYVKLAIVCVLSFFVCTIGINTTGFYLYYKETGFTSAAIEYITQKFGSGVSYFTYVFYRLFVGGQIWNSLVNFALLFAVIPLANNIKPLKINIS